MLSSLRHWSRSAFARLPSLLPSACALCGAADGSGNNLCAPCNRHFYATKTPRCRCCATTVLTPAGMDGVCGECLREPPCFDATVAACDYAAPHDRVVLGLKFGGLLEYAPVMADVMRNAVIGHDSLALPALLAPVPLGSSRLAERGFNQALEIARPLSRLLGIPLQSQLMLRQRETRSQSLLHPDERQKNVRSAFTVSAQNIDLIRGRHVGIVDDVMTTGATLNEVAATLKRFGAARVTNFVFARTPQH